MLSGGPGRGRGRGAACRCSEAKPSRRARRAGSETPFSWGDTRQVAGTDSTSCRGRCERRVGVGLEAAARGFVPTWRRGPRSCFLSPREDEPPPGRAGAAWTLGEHKHVHASSGAPGFLRSSAGLRGRSSVVHACGSSKDWKT